MSVIQVDLRISAEEYQQLYAGAVRDVLAYAHDGRRVRFPARILQPFVTHSGIEGRFLIHFSADNKFQKIERLR